MKVAFYSPNFHPLIGGLETIVKDWAIILTKYGAEVIVVTTTEIIAAENDDCFPFKVFRKLPFFKLIKVLAASDIIVQFNVSLKGIIPCLLSGNPIVISHHSTNYLINGNMANWGSVKYFVSNKIAKANIACSNYVANFLQKVTVIHSSYNASLFKNFEFQQKKYKILFLGRLVSDKGGNVLIDALQYLKQNKAVNLNAIIIGDGSEKVNLIQLADSYNLLDSISFVGLKTGEELVNLLNDAEIMVVPSLWEEPFGIVALEGMACGCKVIVADAGGLPEAVGNKGWIFEKGNAKDLAHTIYKVLFFEQTKEYNTNVNEHLAAFSLPVTGKRVYQILDTISNARNK